MIGLQMSELERDGAKRCVVAIVRESARPENLRLVVVHKTKLSDASNSIYWTRDYLNNFYQEFEAPLWCLSRPWRERSLI